MYFDLQTGNAIDPKVRVAATNGVQAPISFAGQSRYGYSFDMPDSAGATSKPGPACTDCVGQSKGN
jgi:hypothetical protein